MWSDIVISLVTSVSEATCLKVIGKKKIEKFNNKLSTIVADLFGEFSDSSLDNDQFAQMISGKPFQEMLRNYFFSIRDGLSCSEYINRFEGYICNEVPQLNKIEVRRFIKKFNELYTTFLHKVIEENCELNATMQLLTISHRELLGKILESEENLYRYIKSLDKSTVTISDKEILSYHNNCKKEFNKIRFTGISGAEDKAAQDLDSFYVENTFSYYSKEFLQAYHILADEMEGLNLGNFFDYCNKIVLIGAAGLGKSTTLNYLFCKYEDIFGVNALKLKIDLKEYAKDIVEGKKDILWCLAKEFSRRIKRTKLSFADIEKIIADFLERGDCLVILDALDEIPTQPMRNAVRSEIGNFCELYYLNRFIISTREVGYLRNKFDDSFLHIKINEFNNNQIKKYSQNWFKTNYKQSEFKDFWKKFDNEVRKSKCSKLIRNPIVLILALVIFDIEKNLPNRRVEFYKKCIDTFLVVREDRKAAFQMTEKIKNILGDDLVVPKIAHYKFEHISEDAGYKFTSNEVKDAIMEAIEVPDRINWREPVSQYARYLVDRTELLREVDEDIFDFTHKTFYEYFLAVYFSKQLDNKDLVDLLNSWIGDANNDELARLIIEVIIEKNEPRQHKYIIDFMFEQIEEELAKVKQEESKAIDIFLIITDLYKNNMLLPKFHDKYYKCLIYHSQVVGMIELKDRNVINSSIIKVEYDENILSQYYIEELKKHEDFNIIIDAMFYLNDAFKKKVVRDIDDEKFGHISNLFSWIHNNIFHSKKKAYGGYQEILEYFLEEQLSLTLSCPQIFISIVDIIAINNREELIPLLFDFDFEANDVFYDYTAPKILYSIIDMAYQSEDGFLLLLISLIQCAKHTTDELIAYVLSNYRWMRDEKLKRGEVEKRCRRVIWLWEALNGAKNVEQFKEKLLEISLHNEKYDIFYNQFYEEYVENKQEISGKRILHMIEEFNKIGDNAEASLN